MYVGGVGVGRGITRYGFCVRRGMGMCWMLEWFGDAVRWIVRSTEHYSTDV